MTGWTSRWRLKPMAFISDRNDLPLPAARKLLGQGKIIGLTVHSLAEARQAEAAGADYLGVSPIFTTQTKADAGPPAGIQLIQQIKSAVKIPLIAIGGINLANAPEVIQAGGGRPVRDFSRRKPGRCSGRDRKISAAVWQIKNTVSFACLLIAYRRPSWYVSPSAK